MDMWFAANLSSFIMVINNHRVIKTNAFSITTSSHAIVGRSTSLWGNPIDILTGTLDVTRLAVDAVLSIDLQSHAFFPILSRNKFIHSSRTEVLLWSSKHCQVPLHWDSVISESEVRWLVVVMVCACSQSHNSLHYLFSLSH